MKKLLMMSLWLAVAFHVLAVSGDDMISRLDKAISQRPQFLANKERKIDSLKSLAASQTSPVRKLEAYDKLFQEYLTFNFDSTMVYVNRAAAIAEDMADYDVTSQVATHRALSLATAGHFSEAVAILDGIDSGRLSRKVKEEYFTACEWTFGVWAEYSNERPFAPRYTEKSLAYLDSLIVVTDPASPEYSYRLAEKSLRSRDYAEAERLYLATIERIEMDTRLYAQATYALALTYKGLGRDDKYKEWLVNAAISDQIIPLKENLALQQLALYLKTEEGDLERANFYLKIALDDAIFYNNRLRMLEVAEKIPDIANVYQDTIERKNKRLELYLLVIGVLMVLLLCACAYVYMQHRKVSQSKSELAKLNEQLKALNDKLSLTNKSREQYVSLFIDLCAAYIEKLNRFPMVLKLKVKQLSDITSVADRYVRPSEAEIREMFFNFDTAFLKLYPDFIKEFNALLQPDKQIEPKKNELLCTDLRIYALIRMGITDSNKIATLMFYSPQTIFNHRTSVRNRALNRESFEKDIMDICPTLPQ